MDGAHLIVNGKSYKLAGLVRRAVYRNSVKETDGELVMEDNIKTPPCTEAVLEVREGNKVFRRALYLPHGLGGRKVRVPFVMREPTSNVM